MRAVTRISEIIAPLAKGRAFRRPQIRESLMESTVRRSISVEAAAAESTGP
jgi:hypothetical protein